MTSAAVLVPVVFVWLGMVVAISFLEAPLKFRAPGVTIPIGLGIGRLVFKALNAVECLAADAVVVLLGVATPGGAAAVVLLAVAVAVLALQLVVVRPALAKRSDAVLAGADAPGSRAHLWYVALECLKVVGLLCGGILVAIRLAG